MKKISIWLLCAIILAGGAVMAVHFSRIQEPGTPATPSGVKALTDSGTLRLWNDSEKDPAPAPYRLEFDPVEDWSGVGFVSFDMRGNGPRKALKISLTDAAGIERIYGPFWREGNEWKSFEFMPEAATWKVERDADFRLDQVKSMAFLAEPEMGTVELKNFAPVVEEPFADQWRADNLDAAGFLQVDGKRFFPVGLYSLLGENEASAELLFRNSGWENTPENRRLMFEKMRGSGFNTIQSYTSPQFSGDTAEARIAGVRQFLDMAQQADLQVMLNIYGLTALTIPGSATEQAQETVRREEELAGIIAAAQNHPALLAYYQSDEPLSSGTPRRQLNHFYRQIKEWDLQHPVVIVECSDAGFSIYRQAADIMAYDPYPVEGAGPANIAEVSRAIEVSQQATQNSHPAIWAVLQLHQHKERLPSELEMRAMVMQALAKNVRGLFFFAMTYPDADGPLFIRLPEHWAGVERVIGEVNRRMDFCTSDAVTPIRHDVDKVQVLAKKVGDNRYEMVSVYPGNGKEALPETVVTFSGLGNDVTEVTVLDENADGLWQPGATRTIPVRDGAFTDRFTENAAHVYRWETAQ